MGHIYKITNNVNGKIYIGKTECIKPEKRWNQHQRDCRKRTNEKRPLYAAMRKYGITNFTFEVLDKADNSDDLCVLESHYINLYRTYVGFEDCRGYNATIGGEGKPRLQLDEQAVVQYHINDGEYIVANTSNHFRVDRQTIKKILVKHGVTWMNKASANKSRTMSIHGGVCQVNPNDLGVIQYFDTIYEAKLHFNKPTSSNISDACRGKNKSHRAYGFLWYHKDEYEKLIKEQKKNERARF